LFVKWRRRLIGTVAAGGLPVLVFVTAGLMAPVLAPYNPDQISIRDALAPPTAKHVLGTDNQGRDLMSRLLFGARLSLLISVSAVGFGALSGSTLGVLAGYYGRLEMPIMRLMDVLLAFPGVIVALTIIAILGGQGVRNVVLAIAIYQVPQFARLVHGLVLAIRQQPFVESAYAVGLTDARLIARHIVPNTVGPIVVQSSLLIPDAIMTTAVLSFLGLGVPPPTAEWGSMLQNSLQWVELAPHVMIVPGVALMLVVLGFNLFGDGLRDAADPQLVWK
jgi:peptide/nickel transport system permease protein